MEASFGKDGKDGKNLRMEWKWKDYFPFHSIVSNQRNFFENPQIAGPSLHNSASAKSVACLSLMTHDHEA